MLKYLMKTIKQAFLYMRINLLNAMELRATFISEVIGMMLNNIAFAIIWVFFFEKVGDINSWSSAEVLGLEGMVAIAYGVAYALSGGAATLATDINNGKFDNYLVSPMNLYVRILSSYSQVSAFGDIIYGILLMGIFAFMIKMSFIQFLVMVLLIPFAALIFVNFMFVSALIAFLIPDVGAVANKMIELLINPALYPTGLMSNTMRFVFFFIIPALAIGGVPVELIKEPNLVMIVSTIGISLFWFTLAYVLLKKAVLKYESGNLSGIR